MNVLTARIHGILDYVTVVFFLLVPTLFELTGTAATLAYILAVVHLLMTVLTDFPLGIVEVIPFGVHGVVELIVSLALVALPWILGGIFGGARVLYTIIGVVLFIVWLLTNYSATPASTKTSRPAV